MVRALLTRYGPYPTRAGGEARINTRVKDIEDKKHKDPLQRAGIYLVRLGEKKSYSRCSFRAYHGLYLSISHTK
jgi:hypothetical protein